MKFSLHSAFLLSALLALGGCVLDESSFADFPGFDAYYAAYPPRTTLPTDEERALLQRYRPRIFLSQGAPGPIDFYRDYIAHGTLRDENGHVLSTETGSELLNSVRDTLAVFSHEPPGVAPHPVVYGRIDRERFEFGRRTRVFTFLTYTLVFRHSGIPAGISPGRAFVLGLIGDLEDWHQLDHYTAFTLALDEDLRPRVALFQQHNYMRAYVLGAREGPGRLVLPAHGRASIDVAVRSNELYPHRAGRTQRRAASSLSPGTARYLIHGEGTSFLVAPDITDPVREIDPPLAYLAPADAFYTFRGWLGERRQLPGRDGPPGADYNTLPALKERWVQMIVFHWWEDDPAYVDWVGKAAESGSHTFPPDTMELAEHRLVQMIETP